MTPRSRRSSKPGPEGGCTTPGCSRGRRAWEKRPSRPAPRASSSPTGAAGKGRRCPSTTLATRSEEHTSELQSLMRISYAVFCLKKKKHKKTTQTQQLHYQTHRE